MTRHLIGWVCKCLLFLRKRARLLNAWIGRMNWKSTPLFEVLDEAITVIGTFGIEPMSKRVITFWHVFTKLN